MNADIHTAALPLTMICLYFYTSTLALWVERVPGIEVDFLFRLATVHAPYTGHTDDTPQHVLTRRVTFLLEHLSRCKKSPED